MDDCTAEWFMAQQPPQCVASYMNQLAAQQEALDAINGKE
jgi:hypothetical protein